MSKYYYHPLGNLAKTFTDGTASNSEWPHTYDANESGKPHGVGNLDWGSGSNIPQQSEVYSMTDGTITSIYTNHSSGGRGFAIVVRTDRLDSKGKPICIHYIELSGLSEKLANIVGCKAGPMSQSEYGSVNVSYNSPITISMRDHIGYTNDWYGNYSNMHTDFTYEGVGDNNATFLDESSYPTVSEDKLDSSFTLTKLDNGKTKVECNGKIVGRDDGSVRLQTGNSQYYNVWPHVGYMVCQQIPTYLSGSTTASGGISIGTIEEVINGDKMNQEALSCYKTKNLGDNWMGKRPTSLDELNNSSECRGIRYATAVCSQELNFSTYGHFPGASYAKLLRAKMIGEDRSGSSMKEWFDYINPYQFAGKSGWIAKTFSSENSLTFAQIIYDNLKYPDIYGIETFTGTEEFKEAIIYACKQVPIFNLWPIAYAPHAFVVNFNVKTNKSAGNTGGGGNFLMYRRSSGNMAYFKSEVLL